MATLDVETAATEETTIRRQVAGKLVVESNVVARAAIRPAVKSRWENMIIALISSLTGKDDVELHQFAVPLAELAERDDDGNIVTQLDPTQKRRIKAIARELGSKFFELPTDAGEEWLEIVPIFRVLRVDFARGMLTGRLNPELESHYIDLKKEFAKRELAEFSRLRGVYSQNMYRYLNSWRSAGQVTVSLADLRAYLKTTKSLIDYHNFKVKVLDPAHCEITEKTGLQYSWAPVKRPGSKAVESIHFSFPRTRTAAEDVPANEQVIEAEFKVVGSSSTSPTRVVEDRIYLVTPPFDVNDPRNHKRLRGRGARWDKSRRLWWVSKSTFDLDPEHWRQYTQEYIQDRGRAERERWERLAAPYEAAVEAFEGELRAELRASKAAATQAAEGTPPADYERMKAEKKAAARQKYGELTAEEALARLAAIDVNKRVDLT